MEEGTVKNKYEIIVIGGSAGSLEVLLEMLQGLRTNKFSIISCASSQNSMDSVLADVLSLRSNMLVKEADEKESIKPGSLYIAPADYHLLVEKTRLFRSMFQKK